MSLSCPVALRGRTFDDEQVQITIDRACPDVRFEDKFVFVTGWDEQGTRVIVNLDRSAWDAIQAEWPSDPLAGVEDIARQGHWRVYQGQRVWRIDFI